MIRKLPVHALTLLALMLTDSPGGVASPPNPTVTIEAAEDASLFADYPAHSNDGFKYLFSGSTVNSVRRALIRFDLTGVTPPPEPWEARLTLVVQYSGLEAADDLYSLHRMTSGWGEGDTITEDNHGIGVPAEPGDATWASRHHPSDPWTNLGGDFLTEPSATLTIARWDDIRPENNIYTFRDAGLTADVRHWLENPDQNHGWALIGNESVARKARRFWSSEAPEPTVRPRLEFRTLDGDLWAVR